MKNEQNNMSDELLVKYLLGEASESEMAQAQLWINDSINNKKYYSELRQVWNNSLNIAVKSETTTDEAWERFKKKTESKKIPIASNRRYNWLKIAALVLLFIGSGTALFLAQQNGSEQRRTTDIAPQIAKFKTLDTNNEVVKNEQLSSVESKIETNPKKSILAKNSLYKKQIAKIETPKKRAKINEYKNPVTSNIAKAENVPGKTKGIICNGTPCPIEICITQTIKCNGQPSTVSTCSTLEPDESGRLHYKTHDKIGKHCTMSIDEITIKTISTGETIVLNANSKPSTAQDFFKYITGQKKGGILAGVFHDNCNDEEDCGLKFDNSFGELILQ